MSTSAINGQTSPTKILVLGATGGTGRLIVDKAIAQGYDVTALVRSPEKGRKLELADNPSPRERGLDDQRHLL